MRPPLKHILESLGRTADDGQEAEESGTVAHLKWGWLMYLNSEQHDIDVSHF